MFYYAYLNNEDRVVDVYALPVSVMNARLVQITEEQYNDERLIGAKYDRARGVFVFWACSTDNVQYLNTTESLSNKLASIDSSVSSLANEVIGVEGTVGGLRDEVDEKVAAVNSRIDSMQSGLIDDLARLTERIDTNRASIAETDARLSGAVAANQRSIEDLTLADAQTIVDIQNLQAVETQQNAEIARVDQNVEAVIHTVNDHESVINRLEGQVDNLTEATNSNVSSIQTLEGKAETMSMDIYHLYETSHIHDDSIAALEDEVATFKRETAENFDAAQDAVNDLDRRVSANAGDITSLIGSINSAESDISDVKSRVTGVENRATAVENRATTLESSVATNKTNITSVTNKANTNATNISSLTTRVTTAENKINTNKSDIDAVKAAYFPKTGGTVSGDLDVTGVLRMRGSQAFFYNDTAKTMNIGTNNATVVNMAGVHSGGTMNINSATLKTYSVVPRDNNSLLGNATYRWKGIYSQASVNVSSDERLKSDVKPFDKESLAKFIDALEVVRFKYIGCDEKRIGLIAQKVIEADPKLAKFFVNQSSDGYYNLKPADLVFPLIAAVQELKREIDELKK